ncbi:SDR family oxidoreductase [Erwinia sp. S63]|nr:SDR family oxidoreductase [Erwinia sp. S63]
MKDKVNGLVAVVTGGASGIGEATVRKFAAEGWQTIIADVNQERGEAIATELCAEGASVIFRQLDVANQQEVESFSEEVYAKFGAVDALINSGGVLQNAVRITNMPLEDFDRIININLRGTLLMGKIFGARMVADQSGSIINLCSLTTYQAHPQPAYAMSKSALKTLTEVMASEFGPQGVRVNAVAPGYTLTPAMKQRIESGERDPASVIAKSALRRFVEPSEIADAIYFLCSPMAKAITGIVLPIDCGWLASSVYAAAAAQPA